MEPVVTPAEMRAIDADAARRGLSADTLIERAGWAVAREAQRMMGGTYGRRVVVVVGRGNNGADGRVAARLLARRGARVTVIDAAQLPSVMPSADLLVDAAYGTGFRGEWTPPPTDVPVLAVDVPSGVDGLTGCAHGRPWPATATVTFAALKPGLLSNEGRELAGRVVVADIGLDVGPVRRGVVRVADVARWVPPRPSRAHKWNAGLLVVAGSPGMYGAAELASRAAMRAGAGIVHLVSLEGGPSAPVEVVHHSVANAEWSAEVIALAERRFRAAVIGPGLGRGVDTCRNTLRVVSALDVPLVIDGDGLGLVAGDVNALVHRRAATVLTPHDGEYEAIMGHRPGADRLAAATDLASRTGAVCLLKGATTVVAHPDGRVALMVEGDARLATAGTGDVLSGVIGALLARGTSAFEAAAAGALVHARAARRLPVHGVVAGDVAESVADVLSSITDPGVDRAT